MKNKIMVATIKSTGVTVQVYKLNSGGWALYSDGGKTTFTDDQLKF